MATRLSIANAALSALDAETIQSLEQPGSPASHIRDSYEPVRNALLTGTRWTWMTERAPLNRLSGMPVSGQIYQYQYVLPRPDLGSIRAIYDTIDTDVPRVDGWVRQGDSIFADFEQAWIEYPRTITERGFPALFVDALAMALAARIAFAITKDLPTARYFAGVADMALKAAQTDDGQSEPPQRVRTFTWVESRLGRTPTIASR